jgi:dolichyl-phosphate-mannose-protein mannosyltransferase
LYSLLVLALGFVTFFANYYNPPSPFWDENYHVAASQKYQEGVFFLELHPPLGKLLITAGESLFSPNDLSDEEIQETVTTDYLNPFPEGFSFVGVRFFPALLAFLGSYVFFLSLYLILKNPHAAFGFTSLYLFNNAFIVHFRAAMLDGIQLFFILTAILFFLWRWYNNVRWYDFGILGGLISLAVSTKINGVILGALCFALLGKYLVQEGYFESLHVWPQSKTNSQKVKQLSLDTLKLVVSPVLLTLLLFSTVFVGIQAIHFGLARRIEGDQSYDISASFQERVERGDFGLGYVLEGTRESLAYSDQYNVGVPQLDETNPKENGSYPLDWVVGRKSISYRWDRYVVARDDHRTYGLAPSRSADVAIAEYNDSQEIKDTHYLVTRYLYLQVNPIIWGLSLLGFLLSLLIIGAALLFKPKSLKSNEILLMLPFLVMYIAYFITVLQVQRVLYLYHSFIPILFGFFLLSLSFKYWIEHSPYNLKNDKVLVYGVSAFVFVSVFIAFVFFAPFTYHLPLTNEEFDQRKWTDVWSLRNASEQDALNTQEE